MTHDDPIPDLDPRPDRPLTDDADLEEFLGLMLERATHRQFWMIFLDRNGRLADPIMPMDDHPLEPDDLFEVPDLGEVPFRRIIVQRAGWVCDMIGGASAVFVWERVGPPRPDESDLRWAEAIATEAESQGVPLRAQFLLHATGIRLLDDLVNHS